MPTEPASELCVSEPWEFLVEAADLSAFAKAIRGDLGSPGRRSTAMAPLTFPVTASASRISRLLYEALGLNRERVLHGGQSYEYFRRLCAGDRLRCSTRIVSDQRKTGKRSGPMRVIERQTEMREAATGQLVVVEAATTVELQNPKRESVRATAAESLAWDKKREFGTLTRADFAQYAEAAGDRNPLHIDEQAARRAGYATVFGHGMLSAGLLGTFIDEFIGADDVVRFAVRFVDQVIAGDSLTALRLAGSGSSSDCDGHSRFELALVNQHGFPVATGSAVTRPSTARSIEPPRDEAACAAELAPHARHETSNTGGENEEPS